MRRGIVDFLKRVADAHIVNRVVHIGDLVEWSSISYHERSLSIADAILDAGSIPVVPHLTLLWRLISPKPYQRWLEYDQHLLARCDVVLRVPGDSQGATRETEFAEEFDIPVGRPARALAVPAPVGDLVPDGRRSGR